MRYKLLGKSGLRVSEICLGTMTFGEDWGWGAPKEESEKILRAFSDSGGNFIDTSINYTDGTSEKFLGEFLEGDRDRFVVATKYTLSTRKSDPNAGGNHRKNMLRSLETSLKRLKTDYVDLYWLHMWDYTTPIEEVMRALDDVVRSGKVHYVGVSDTPAWVASRANTMAEANGWTPFVGLQVPYSLTRRDAERELLPMARSLDLAFCAWGPLAAGLLTGKYTGMSKEKPEGRLSRPDWGVSERGKKIAAEVDRVASEAGCSSAQVALNWVRQQRGVVIPIVGATKPSQMKDNLGCLEFQLNQDQMKRLDEATKIDLGFPHEFLKDDEVRELIFGGTFPLIDNHRT